MRSHTPDSDRAVIAKLRAKVAQLEAKLASARDAPPAEIDLSKVSMDDFARKWAPTPEEEAQVRAELIERLTIFGRNTGTLSEEKVRALPREVRESICNDWRDESDDWTPLEDHVQRALMDSFLVPRPPIKKVHFRSGKPGFPKF